MFTVHQKTYDVHSAFIELTLTKTKHFSYTDQVNFQ